MSKGRIHAVHLKPKTRGERGLPKLTAAELRIYRGGVEGDYNHYRQSKLGGDRNKAVLLLPIEVLMALQREGWGVQPGHLGENVTVEGIPNEHFAIGQRYRLGSQVEVEISEPCIPCSNLSRLPYVGQFRAKAFIKTMIGRRGWYARVLSEGCVRPFDPIEQV